MGLETRRSRRLPPPRRTAGAPRAVPVALGVLLLVTATGGSPAAASPADGSTSVQLVDDDDGVGLFDSRGMHPGRAESACVTVSTTGRPDPADAVRLHARVTAADLAPYLLLTLEVGSLAASGGCDSFTGRQVWSGSLADMPGDAVSAIPTGWRPADAPVAVYRFTARLRDDQRAQGRSASASFVWTLYARSGPGPIPPPPAPEPAPPSPSTSPTPQREPIPDPELSPAAAPSASTAAPTAPTGPDSAAPPVVSAPSRGSSATPARRAASPTPDGAPASTAGPASPAGDNGRSVIEAPPLKVGPTTTEKLTATALSVARNSHFPLLLVLLVVGFVALQGALDRRDPKLALARVRQDLSDFRDFPETARELP